MSTKKTILIIFAFALVAGFFWNYRMFNRPLSSSDDEMDYNRVAQNILNYGKFSVSANERSAVNEPMYPLFLSGVFFVFGQDSFNAVRAIQIFIFALIVMLAYVLSSKFFDRKHAVCVSVGMALFFPLAISAGRLHKEIFFSFLVALLAFCLYKIQETKKFHWFAMGGFILGLSILTNAVLQLFPFFVLLGFILIFKKKILTKNILTGCMLFLITLLLPLLAWTFRGYFSGSFEPLSLKTGGALSRRAEMITNIRGERYWRHLGGQLFGYYFVEKEGFNPAEFLGHSQTTARFYELMNVGYSIKKINEILGKESRGVILRNIPRYVAISLLDFLQFNGLMLPGNETMEAMPGQNLFTGGSHSGLSKLIKVAILAIVRIFYWLFFGFVFYGFFKSFKEWKKFGWVILIVVYFNLIYSAVFGIPRYAIPVYVFYIILFVNGILCFVRKCFSKKSGLTKNDKQVKDFYHEYHDAIFDKRFNSPFPLRQYVHRLKYDSIRGKIFKGESVLDVGCGDGILPILLAQDGYNITACDISEPNIEQAKKLAEKYGVSDKIKFMIGDAENLPFKNESFDVVLSSHVLEHLPDFKKGLSELRRVSKKRAIIALPSCLNLCSFAQMGGDSFWKLSKKSLYALPWGFARVIVNLFNDGVDEGYAGENNLPHVSRYPWVIKREIKKAGFKIKSFEADSLCFPYFNFLLPVVKFLDKFKSKPVLRNFGYGSLAVAEKN